VAASPVVPIAFVVWGGIRRHRERDELERRIMLEAYAFAARAMILVSIGYGFLANAGFRPVNSVYFGAGLIGMTAIGRVLVRRTYG
jgi:hypothetical protein